MNIDYPKFIREHFMVKNKLGQEVVFGLNHIQSMYYMDLLEVYGPGLVGVREIILKARQEGLSTFILGIFSVDFLVQANCASICLAHRDDDTKKLFQKVHFFVEKAALKVGKTKDDILGQDTAGHIVNKLNGSEFFIATAGAKVGARGGTVQNILFSESAFYPDTERIKASEIIEGTSQMVAQDYGKIFIESTANGEGNDYHKRWKQAVKKRSTYRAVFFSWRDNPEYTDEYMAKKRMDFTSDDMFKQEYPETPEEAFISSGSRFFDTFSLQELRKNARKPRMAGWLAPDGTWMSEEDILDNQRAALPAFRLYRKLEPREQFVLFADPAEGGDACAAKIMSKKHGDFPFTYQEHTDSATFGHQLYKMAKYVRKHTGYWPTIGVERNTGAATINVLVGYDYPQLYKEVLQSTEDNYGEETTKIGWHTNETSRIQMLDEFARAIKQKTIKEYDEPTFEEWGSFIRNKRTGKPEAGPNANDDLVMVGAGCLQLYNRVDMLDEDLSSIKAELPDEKLFDGEGYY